MDILKLPQPVHWCYILYFSWIIFFQLLQSCILNFTDSYILHKIGMTQMLQYFNIIMKKKKFLSLFED